MKAKITGIERKESRTGGVYFLITFFGEDGKSYKTHAYPLYAGQPVRNFPRWERAIARHRCGKEVILKNLCIKKGKTINADSLFETC